MQVLVAAPHPDDDIIGCGGTLARHIRTGNQVTIVFMTNGDAGSLEKPKPELAFIRANEARDAAATLGVSDLVFLGNEDGYLECSKDNIIHMVSLIRDKRPDVVYIPTGHDNHRDHRITNELLVEAIRRAQGSWFQECGGVPWKVENVFCYEIWTPLQNVSYVENITEFMELKMEAVRKHSSQIRDIAYDDAVRGLNRFRGVTTGKGVYCECFEVLSISGK